jgi:tetratricopeptide (TPR) repeat protein
MDDIILCFDEILIKIEKLKKRQASFSAGKNRKKTVNFEDNFQSQLRTIYGELTSIWDKRDSLKLSSHKPLKELVFLCSQMGFLALAEEFFEILVSLPFGDDYPLQTLLAAKYMVLDYALCHDFKKAMKVFMAAEKCVSTSESNKVFMGIGERLLDSLGANGLTSEAFLVHQTMQKNVDQMTQVDISGATLHLIGHLKEQGELSKAIELYYEMEKYDHNDDCFFSRVKAGLSLFLPVSKLKNDAQWLSLMVSLTPNLESLDRTLLRTKAAISTIKEMIKERNLDEARGILDVMENLCPENQFRSLQIKAGLLVVSAYLENDLGDYAYTLYRLIPLKGIDEETYKDYLKKGLDIVVYYKDVCQDEFATDVLKYITDLAKNDKEKIILTKSFMELIKRLTNMDMLGEAEDLYLLFQIDSDNPTVIKLHVDMGATVARSLAHSGFIRKALDIFDNLPDLIGDETVLFTRLQIQMDIFNSFLTYNQYQKAFNFWKSQAVFTGSKRLAYRWTKATEKLIEAYVDSKDLTNAKKVYDLLRERLGVTEEKFIIRLYAMSLELMIAYSEKGDMAHAREIFDTLPDSRSSKRLENEKAELTFFLMLEYSRNSCAEEAISFFKSIPVSGGSARLSNLKAKGGVLLIDELCSMGLINDAIIVYKTLESLGLENGLDVIRVKAALKLIRALVAAERGFEALELIKTIPLFYEPKKVSNQLNDINVALSFLFSRNNERDNVMELRAFMKNNIFKKN